MIRHEAGWDRSNVYCSCGWISKPSNKPGEAPKRKDQQSQFIAHLREASNEEGKQLSDSDQ